MQALLGDLEALARLGLLKQEARAMLGLLKQEARVRFRHLNKEARVRLQHLNKEARARLRHLNKEARAMLGLQEALGIQAWPLSMLVSCQRQRQLRSFLRVSRLTPSSGGMVCMDEDRGQS